ncbi:hypothetical protein C8J56DRAFT_932777 [Mycena floridula]|nr:hypothetical protein C8J56DRAFT_932777 [Mycena floridula]
MFFCASLASLIDTAFYLTRLLLLFIPMSVFPLPSHSSIPMSVFSSPIASSRLALHIVAFLHQLLPCMSSFC